MMMKIKAIAPWFGGKRTLAPRIVAELGTHDQFFEPFCGSMSIVLAKPIARQETVNDLHGDLMNLAMVLADQEAAVTLYDKLQQALFHEGLLLEAQERINADPPAACAGCMTDRTERSYWYFLACWMARNGLAGTNQDNYQLAVRWTAGGGSPTTRFRSAVESIPAWHERLRHVVMLNRDAFEIVPKFEDRLRTVIYVDSPYAREARSGFGGNGSHSSRYRHEFTNHETTLLGGDDHAKLADELCRFTKSRVVVSHYDCPRVRELYSGWTFVDCATQKNLHVQNRRGVGRCEAPEVLIINGPSYTEAQQA